MPARLKIDDDPAKALDAATATLRQGGIVVFPTETFYGLAVDPANEAALRRLASLKDRYGSKPVPLIAASRAACERLGPLPAALMPLCEVFWPGPLTVAIEPFATWPHALLGGGHTLGVRVSSHPFAQAFATAAGGLITSTSANLAGKAPATQVEQLDTLFAQQVDLIVDGGKLAGGLPSTVVYSQGDSLVMLRAGAISEEQLKSVAGAPPIIV